jgi:hypothetical protein
MVNYLPTKSKNVRGLMDLADRLFVDQTMRDEVKQLVSMKAWCTDRNSSYRFLSRYRIRPNCHWRIQR